ncbi:hypothetical protein EYF80_007217 [Liparis tanakae]|uniref:Uncharacterized protein n=1 Tax=Liparis tanakae TaxID=230148 RepID=A0A4Z2IXH7_9TELE|nr:hypothetical protein EYF80_007217 [Liparis tanakae]
MVTHEELSYARKLAGDLMTLKIESDNARHLSASQQSDATMSTSSDVALHREGTTHDSVPFRWEPA